MGDHFVRKNLKADREKSRRCRLNTQFVELENALGSMPVFLSDF